MTKLCELDGMPLADHPMIRRLATGKVIRCPGFTELPSDEELEALPACSVMVTKRRQRR